MNVTYAELEAVCPRMVDGEKCGADILVRADHFDDQIQRVRWLVNSRYGGWQWHEHQPNHDHEYVNDAEHDRRLAKAS